MQKYKLMQSVTYQKKQWYINEIDTKAPFFPYTLHRMLDPKTYQKTFLIEVAFTNDKELEKENT